MIAIYILAGIGALCILTTVVTITLAMVISIQNGKRYITNTQDIHDAIRKGDDGGVY